VIQVNIHQAKTHLSRLLRRVIAGEEVVISRAGRPLAKIVPLAEQSVKREIGTDEGAFHVPDDFNEPLPEEIMVEFER
jgi:prevent-host-death family protein